MPLDEAKDLTCAEAAARVLKWLPDTARTSTTRRRLPELSVLPRSELPSKTIDLSSGLVKSVKVGPRPDLAVSAVSIKYESEHSDGANSWLTVEEDNYPPDAAHGGRNAVVMSVELAGMKGSCQIYEIECRSIQPNSAQWWRDRIPALSDAEDLEVLSSKRQEDSEELPRFLVSGTIHPSMNFLASRERVDAVVQYTGKSGSVVKREIGVRFVATNAVTGTYAVRSTSQYAEPVPSGLAKAVYDAASAMQYEGSAEIFGADADDFAAAKIRISGGRSEWETMDSPCARRSRISKRHAHGKVRPADTPVSGQNFGDVQNRQAARRAVLQQFKERGNLRGKQGVFLRNGLRKRRRAGGRGILQARREIGGRGGNPGVDRARRPVARRKGRGENARNIRRQKREARQGGRLMTEPWWRLSSVKNCFVFPAPFPTPPKEGAVAEGETALGPFTLAEAVRVFWSLKSLDLDMSISVKYSAGDTVYADVDERYDDLRPSANCTASLDPYKRCAGKQRVAA